ncbi:MAG: pitrilysin family protein [Pseudomonadota bacterium]
MPSTPHKTNLLFVIAFAIIFFASLSAQAKVFNAKEFKLDNGLQVIVVENNRAPVITHMLWYKVGAADEQAGFSGMAHYLEHLLFKGTETIGPGEFSRIVKKNGGSDNAFTSYDYTAYFQSVPKEHLEKMMQLEADRMFNTAPPPDHYASEKKVVLEERRQVTENDPRSLFGEQMRSMLFTNHPYGTPVIGWMDEIKTYEWDDVRAFYQDWYAPNNAILIVSGDVKADEVKELAEKIYGGLAAKELPVEPRPVLPPSAAKSSLTLEHPSIHQESFQRIYLAPSYAEKRKDALALDLLQEILSGGPTTRIYQSLVVEQKIAVSAGLSFSGGSEDYGTTWLYGTPVEGVSLQQLETALEAEIEKVIRDGVTAKELNDAIKRMQDAAIFARDSIAGPAMIIGRAITTGQTLEQVENWPEEIASITVDDIQKAVTQYLDRDNPWHRTPVSGYLKPKKEEPKEGEIQ